MNLSMRPAKVLMIALSNDFAFVNDNASHHRIGRHIADSKLGKIEAALHKNSGRTHHLKN
jgi:hypothetical protein